VEVSISAGSRQTEKKEEELRVLSVAGKLKKSGINHQKGSCRVNAQSSNRKCDLKPGNIYWFKLTGQLFTPRKKKIQGEGGE